MSHPRRFALRIVAGILLPLVTNCGEPDDASRFLLTLDPALTPLMGFLDVQGEVKLPAPIPRGKIAVFGLTRGRPVAFGIHDVMVEGTAPLQTATIAFRLRSLAPGPYTLFVSVDLDGDGKLGSGDLAGYYDGTSLGPLQDPSIARILELRGNQDQIDFGIGVLR